MSSSPLPSPLPTARSWTESAFPPNLILPSSSDLRRLRCRRVRRAPSRNWTRVRLPKHESNTRHAIGRPQHKQSSFFAIGAQEGWNAEQSELEYTYPQKLATRLRRDRRGLRDPCRHSPRSQRARLSSAALRGVGRHELC